MTNENESPSVGEIEKLTRIWLDADPADNGDLHCQNPEWENLDQRLEKKFGGGDRPDLRTRLFDRLIRDLHKYGLPVWRIILSADRSSRTARDVPRYFCCVVSKRMREAGFFRDDSVGPSF